MATNRRIGSENSETRRALLLAAEQLMREEGYAQVTSRKLAKQAGLKPQLVHYYFRTMGELFEELFRTSTEEYLRLLDKAAASKDPLVSMFELSCDSSTAGLQLEFLALANHRKEMHALIAEFGEELNRREAAILRAAMAAEGIELPDVTAEDMAMILETVARGLAFAGKFDQTRFVKARNTIIGWLRLLTGQPKTGASTAGP